MNLSETSTPITITRHASFDDVHFTDRSLLGAILCASVTRYAGTRLGPVGSDLPFQSLRGPNAGFRIPPTVGDDILADELQFDSIYIEDQRVEPTVEVRPESLGHRHSTFMDAARAAAEHPRGVIAWKHDSRFCVAALLAESVRPASGVVLVRDNRAAQEALNVFGGYGVPARLAPEPMPRRNTLRRVVSAGPQGNNPDAWMIVPARHRDWVDGLFKVPGIIICADAVHACKLGLRHRLFGHPAQRVYGLIATDRYYPAEEVHWMFGSYGHEIHRCRA